MTKNKFGKIKTSTTNKSDVTIKVLLISLIVITVYAFLTFDYKEINFSDAVTSTLRNIKTVFLEPRLT